MEPKHVGTCNALFRTKNGQSFYIYTIKEPTYVMQMIETYGSLDEIEDGTAKHTYKDNKGVKPLVKFYQTVSFHDYYKIVTLWIITILTSIIPFLMKKL